MKLKGIRNVYLLGDLHFGVKNNSIEYYEIQKDFLVNWFISKIKEDGFDPDKDVLFQAGDWNHVRESTNNRVSNQQLEIFDILTKEFKRGIHIILGNHDVYYKDRNDIHSLRQIDLLYKDVKIYEKPETLEINGKHKFLMLPWESNDETITNTVKKYSNKVDYILCHSDIKNFKLNRFQKIEHGLNPLNLKSFKKIYSGHIHIRQSAKNIVYVGTPFHLDKGDCGNTKGFYKLNMESDEIIETFFENTHSPKYIKANITELLDMNVNEISTIFKNNFVDVLIDSEMSKVFPLTNFLDLITKCGHRTVTFIPFTKDRKQSKEEDVNIEDNYEYNIFEILKIYLESRDTPYSISKNIIKVFTDAYNKSKNKEKEYE